MEQDTNHINFGLKHKTSKAFLLFDSQLWALPLPAPSSNGEGSGEGSFVGQILAHFPQLLGRFRRQVCRAQVDRVPMTCYHRPHFKDVEPEALRGQESPASDPSVHRKCCAFPSASRVGPLPPLPGPAPKSSGSKMILPSTFTKRFPLLV